MPEYIESFLKKHPSHPLFTSEILNAKKLILDLSPQNLILSQLLKKNNLSHNFLNTVNHYILTALQHAQTPYSIGRYLEKRVIYEGTREFHLGLDIGAPVGTPIYCPWDGVVHSFQDNNRPGDYGPTLILVHEWGSVKFYTLYGHLSRKDLSTWSLHKTYRAGDLLGHMGSTDENGGWLAHLHIQIIKQLHDPQFQPLSGDYPGICAEQDLAFYQANTLDPAQYLAV